jgi:hypothetical protein
MVKQGDIIKVDFNPQKGFIGRSHCGDFSAN